MSTRVLRDDIEPQALQPQRIGLFDRGGAASLPPDTLERLAGGIGYVPLDPSTATVAGSSYDPCDAQFAIAEDQCSADDGAVEWYAWGIAKGYELSTLNGGDRSLMAAEDAATKLLTAQTSYLGANTFWTGLVGGVSFNALGWPNIALTDSAGSPVWTDLTPADGEAGLVEAMGLILEYLAETLQGLRGTIHVPQQALPYLNNSRLVVRDGYVLGTALGDHLVISDAGYPGWGPGNVPQPDNRTWFYATSMVRTGTAPIETNAAYDRAHNQAKAIAARAVLAEWDLTAHAGIRVCLTDPGPECAAVGS